MGTAIILAAHLFATPPAVRLGAFSCVAVGARRNAERGHVTCTGPRERRLSVSLAGEQIQVSATQVLGRPMLVAVGAYYSGDDEWYETAILAIEGDRMRDLWPHHWITAAEDVLCLGDIGSGNLGVMSVVSDWVGRGEAHGQPHEFRITRYHITENGVDRAPAVWTAGRYDTWCPAVTGARLSCPHPYGDIKPLRWHTTFECGEEPQNNAYLDSSGQALRTSR